MFIVGASTLGRIAAEVATRSGAEIQGFFDDESSSDTFCNFPVLGPVEMVTSYTPVRQHGLFIAVGDNNNRAKLLRRLPGPLVNIIDTSAVVERSVTIGQGNLIMASVYIGSQSSLGDGNLIFAGTALNHDVEVGDCCFIGPNSILAGHVRLKDQAKLGSGCVVCEGVELGTRNELRPGEVRCG